MRYSIILLPESFVISLAPSAIESQNCNRLKRLTYNDSSFDLYFSNTDQSLNNFVLIKVQISETLCALSTFMNAISLYLESLEEYKASSWLRFLLLALGLCESF